MKRKVADALVITLLITSWLLGSAACEPNDETNADAGACDADSDCPERGVCVDHVCQDCSSGLPEANDPCLPKCGNAIGVGQPCSAGGGECNEFIGSGAGICTVDFVPDADLHMCTRPCADDADCGGDAVCQGDPADPDSDKGCVPVSCAD